VNRETATDDALKADSADTKTGDKSDKTLLEALSDGVLSLLSSILGNIKRGVFGAIQASTRPTVDSVASPERPMSPAEATE